MGVNSVSIRQEGALFQEFKVVALTLDTRDQQGMPHQFYTKGDTVLCTCSLPLGGVFPLLLLKLILLVKTC